MSVTEFIIIALFALFIYGFIRASRMINKVLAHWHHKFDAQPFTPQEFYASIEKSIEKKGLDKVSLSRTTYSEGGLLSPNREYVKIQYKEFIFLVCAAPFAKEFFVSWWLGETGNPIRDLFSNTPILNKLFSKREKTFFEVDTIIMFKETVRDCVRDSIDGLSDGKGLRKLSQDEWKEYNKLFN